MDDNHHSPVSSIPAKITPGFRTRCHSDPWRRTVKSTALKCVQWPPSLGDSQAAFVSPVWLYRLLNLLRAEDCNVYTASVIATDQRHRAAFSAARDARALFTWDLSAAFSRWVPPWWTIWSGQAGDLRQAILVQFTVQTPQTSRCNASKKKPDIVESARKLLRESFRSDIALNLLVLITLHTNSVISFYFNQTAPSDDQLPIEVIRVPVSRRAQCLS